VLLMSQSPANATHFLTLRLSRRDGLLQPLASNSSDLREDRFDHAKLPPGTQIARDANATCCAWSPPRHAQPSLLAPHVSGVVARTITARPLLRRSPATADGHSS
jgi:hypothetical protein